MPSHRIFMKLTRPFRNSEIGWGTKERPAAGDLIRSPEPANDVTLPRKTPHGPTTMGNAKSGISSKN